MEIRLGVIDRRPGNPMGIDAFACRFIKISMPYSTRLRFSYIGECTEYGEGNPVLDCPVSRFRNLGVDHTGQRMGNFDAFNIRRIQFSECRPWFRHII